MPLAASFLRFCNLTFSARIDKNGYNQMRIIKHLKQMSQNDKFGDVLPLDDKDGKCSDDSSKLIYLLTC